MTANVHYNIRVRGKVQGVWFRKTTQLKAFEMGLRGFVKNEPDGSVYMEVEGPEDVVEKFAQWCWEGSPLSKVSQVDIEAGTLQNFEKFSVKKN